MDLDTQLTLYWIFCIVCVIFMISINVIGYKKKKRQERERFYKECKKNKIYFLDAEINRQRATAIAKKLGIRFTDITEYFESTKIIIEKEIQKKAKKFQKKAEKWNQREIEYLKEREKDFLIESTKYAELIGVDKRIAMMLEEKEKTKEKLTSKLRDIDASEKALLAGYALTQTKEKDWATAGGIAQGIAGGAAGLAVALDIQAKNAQIRELNSKRGSEYVSATMGASLKLIEEKSKIESELEEIEKNFNKALKEERIKLVSAAPKEEVFKKLTFDKTEVSISKTGAFKIKTCVKGCNFTIFNERPAVVDGTIVATLYQNNCKVGNALLVLPRKGISTRVRKAEGICICNADKNIPYEVKFAPYHLWEIEE